MQAVPSVVGEIVSDNIIARLRRAASKVMPEDPVRVRMTAHDADFLADSADGYRALVSHLDRQPREDDYEDLEEFYVEHSLWADVLEHWAE